MLGTKQRKTNVGNSYQCTYNKILQLVEASIYKLQNHQNAQRPTPQVMNITQTQLFVRGDRERMEIVQEGQMLLCRSNHQNAASSTFSSACCCHCAGNFRCCLGACACQSQQAILPSSKGNKAQMHKHQQNHAIHIHAQSKHRHKFTLSSFGFGPKTITDAANWTAASKAHITMIHP